MVEVSARLIAVTQPLVKVPGDDAEGLIAYAARVSNPDNQYNEDTEGLLRYCIRNKHWSVFEMADAVIEVKAPRDISRQLLRHRSFSFQEFSQRYSDQIWMTSREFRRQDQKNRQNSIDDLPGDLVDVFTQWQKSFSNKVMEAFKLLRSHDVAKECARVILPEGLTMSTLYVKGSIRSWLHYLEVRDDPGVTQYEHVLLARAIREQLAPAFPVIFAALEKEA